MPSSNIPLLLRVFPDCRYKSTYIFRRSVRRHPSAAGPDNSRIVRDRSHHAPHSGLNISWFAKGKDISRRQVAKKGHTVTCQPSDFINRMVKAEIEKVDADLIKITRGYDPGSIIVKKADPGICLLYTSDAADDL